jgi:hypothetical protein
VRRSMSKLAFRGNTVTTYRQMTAKAPLQRVAFSPGEFAALFGKSQTWGYRQIYAGKIKAITEYGRFQIPASEVERVLGSAGTYNGLKPKVAKKNVKRDGWRQFLEDRRKATGITRALRFPKSSNIDIDPRTAAFARLTRGNDKRLR